MGADSQSDELVLDSDGTKSCVSVESPRKKQKLEKKKMKKKKIQEDQEDEIINWDQTHHS